MAVGVMRREGGEGERETEVGGGRKSVSVECRLLDWIFSVEREHVHVCVVYARTPTRTLILGNLVHSEIYFLTILLSRNLRMFWPTYLLWALQSRGSTIIL